jgi:hypothetical protein
VEQSWDPHTAPAEGTEFMKMMGTVEALYCSYHWKPDGSGGIATTSFRQRRGFVLFQRSIQRALDILLPFLSTPDLEAGVQAAYALAYKEIQKGQPSP